MGELNWVYTGLVLLVLSTVFYALRIFKDTPFVREGAWGFMLLSLLCMSISLVIRSISAKYFALSNMYESLLMVGISIQLAFLFLDRWFNVKTLGFPVGILLLITFVYNLTLPTEIAPLQPALQSYWRSIHVPVILLSYAMFTLAFICSVVYLVIDYFKKTPPSGGQRLALAEGPQPDKETSTTLAMAQHLEVAAAKQGVNVYDEVTYRCVAFGFPLLTLGIILGGMWANEAWGNYWSWDPKESMSLVTLLGYGVYLHMRVNGSHSIRTLSWVSVIGFVLMLITYFGVNMMGLGLHSYGKIG